MGHACSFLFQIPGFRFFMYLIYIDDGVYLVYFQEEGCIVRIKKVTVFAQLESLCIRKLKL